VVYLRNTTNEEQWLEDPQTGIKRKVAGGALTRVTPEVADLTLAKEPEKWERVVAIALAPRPAGEPPV